MVNQNEISERVKNMIGIELCDKFSSETFEEMANEPELEQWINELLRAEEEWWAE